MRTNTGRAMSRLAKALWLAAGMIMAVRMGSAAEARNAGLTIQDLGRERHLFIDAMGLEKVEGVVFQVNPPRATETVLRNEFPWENIGEYSNVLDDGSGEYKMYYLNTGRGRHGYTALATSRDGIHWQKPRLGLIEFQGSKENNLLIEPAVNGSVCFDPADPDASRRYKLVTSYPIDDQPDTPWTEGMVIYTSPDGLRWTKHEFNIYPYIQDSQTVLFRDPYLGKYVLYFRGNSERIGRHVMYGQTDDPMKPWPFTPNPKPLYVGGHELPYMDWVELPTVMARDDLDPDESDLYGNQVFLYPWARRVYLAFPTCYYRYRGGRAYLSPKPGNVGVGECQLATSRDGRHWTRHRRPAYLKHGWWGDHYAYWPWVFQGMVRQGRWLYQYAILRGTGHGSIRFIEGAQDQFKGVVRLEQDLDRFIGAEFAYTGGRIVSEPILCPGGRLTLNVDAGGMGEGRVGLLGEDGTPIPGFTVEDCDLINGDWLEKPVQWKRGESRLESLAGRTIRLEFRMRGTRLYAMQFVELEPGKTVPGQER